MHSDLASKSDLRQMAGKIDKLNASLKSLKLKVAKLQNKSQDCESLQQCSTGYGSSATPMLLHNAFSLAKTAVLKFSTTFVEALKSKGYLMRRSDQMYWFVDSDPPVSERVSNILSQFVVRSDSPEGQSYLTYAHKAVVYELFFEGFENESFNASCGVSRYLEPSRRQAKFYEFYFLQQKQSNADFDDPQYDGFCRTKVSGLWKIFHLSREIVRGPCVLDLELCFGAQLCDSFLAASKSVWLLHKLAFSFEPPAAIFRVQSRANFDSTYMDSVVDLAERSRFATPTVGFMIAPGLRLQKTIFRSEVHLAQKYLGDRVSDSNNDSDSDDHSVSNEDGHTDDHRDSGSH